MPRKSGNRLRLLAWCDSPLSITGFGVVAKNILGRIHDSGRFDVACVGINHFDEHVERIWEARDDVPYRVFVGQDLARQENGVLVPVDPMGRQRALNMVAGGDADVFFVMRDLWDMVVPQMPGQPPFSAHFPLRLQAAKERGRNFRVLAHFPLEYQLQPQWRPMLDAIDYGLCFTEAGMPQLAPWKDSVAFAQQGADAAVFKPLPREGWGEAVVLEPGPGGPIRRAVRIADAADFRRRKMMLPEGPLFVVTCVNRNQPRKDIPATIAAFRRFLELRGGGVPGGPRPVLWLQMRPDDAFGDVRQAVAAEGLEVGRDVFFPPYFNVGVGWTEAELNMLYNASDLFVSTSVAEGFGLCVSPDTQIDVLDGVKTMRDVAVGDEVLVEDGTYRKVLDKVERKVDSVFRVVANGGEGVRVTAEHPFYVIKRATMPEVGANPASAKSPLPEWIRADQLKAGWFVGTPIPQLGSDRVGRIDLAADESVAGFDLVTTDETVACKMGYSPKTGERVEYNRYVEIDDDFLRFAGWFVAEGSTPNCRVVELDLGAADGEEVIGFLSDYMRRVLGMSVDVRRIDSKVNIVGCSSIHAKFFEHHFGKFAGNKRIPSWLYRRASSVGPMITGIFMGDGYSKRNGIILASKSRNLIGQLRTMLLADEIPTSINRDQRTGCYSLSVCRQGYGRFEDMVGFPIPKTNGANFNSTDRTARRFFFRDGMAFTRISSIEKVQYNDVVQDIHVDGVHSFVGNGLLLHNTNVEAGMAGCPTLVPGHTGFLQTARVLGMPYVKTAAPEVRPQIADSPVHPTDVGDMAERILAHYREPAALRAAVESHLAAFRRTFSWDEVFKTYWEPTLAAIEEDLRGTEGRRRVNAGRYLYVCDEAFGDVLGATKAMAGLKRERPGVPIDFMTKPQFADVTTGNPDVDRVVPWDLNRLHDYPPRQVFYPHAAIRSGAWSNGHTHLLAMQAEMIGVQPGPAFIADEPFDLALPGVELRSSASADFVAPIVTVHATSQGGKMIAPDRWAAVVKYLQERHKDVRFVLVGGPSDLYVPGTLDLRYDHARRAPLSYRRMAFVQRHAICHLGIDSGPAHCAATVGTPSLVAWGWTDVDTCRPERYAVNLVPHYPTVCPRLGPCHGVQPACGINQYDRASAMQAPCVATLDLTPIVTILDEALGQGEPAACREWLRANSSKYRLVYAIPAPPPAPEAAAARPAA